MLDLLNMLGLGSALNWALNGDTIVVALAAVGLIVLLWTTRSWWQAKTTTAFRKAVFFISICLITAFLAVGAGWL